MLDTATLRAPDAESSSELTPSPSLPTAQLAQWCDRHRYWLFAGIVLIYLAGLTGHWRIGPDTAVHMAVARNIAAGQGYTHPTDLHRHINPGLSQLTAATFRVFGSDQFFAINAVMTLLAVGVLGLNFALMRMHFDRPTSVVVTLLLGITAGVYQPSIEVLTDLPFLAGVLLFLIGFDLLQRSSYRIGLGLAMLVAGTAVMAAFRSVVLTFMAAMAVVFMVRIIRGPQRLRFTAVAAVAMASAVIMRLADPRKSSGAGAMRDETKVLSATADLTGSASRALIDNLPKLLSDALPKALVGIDLGTPMHLAISVVAVVGLIALCRKNIAWGLVLGFFILQWLLFTTATRYVLAVLPLCTLGWWLAVRILEMRSPARWRPAVAVSLLAVWVVPNLVAVGKLTWEQHQPSFWKHYENGAYQPLIAMGDAIQEHVAPTDVVIADNANQLTYLSDRRVFGPVSLRRLADRNRTLNKFKNADQLWVILPMEGRLKRKLPPLDIERKHVVAEVARPDGPPLHLHKASFAGVKSQANREKRENRERMQREKRAERERVQQEKRAERERIQREQREERRRVRREKFERNEERRRLQRAKREQREKRKNRTQNAAKRSESTETVANSEAQ